MRAQVRDTEIYFDIDGASLVPDGLKMIERPTAFLLHGGPGSDHSGVKSRYGRLSERVQSVYFDFRGQGRSARGDPKRYTLDENVEDMEALRRHLGLGPIVSLGTSYGGMVAMAHAARYPESVSHLILVATAACGKCIMRARELVAERGTETQVEQFEALISGTVDTVQRLRHYYEVMASLYTCKGDPVFSDAGLSRSILSPEALVQAYGPEGYMRRFDIRAELSAIVAPTLKRFMGLLQTRISVSLRKVVTPSVGMSLRNLWMQFSAS
jgi:proline iminopeptidase